MNQDEKWMAMALNEAEKAKDEGEVPIGAVLIRDDKLIAKSHNQPISTHDATAHAEVQLIRLAGKKKRNYRLNESSIYVTLEPCIMCLGSIMNARITRIVFGSKDYKIGACAICEDKAYSKNFNHKIIVDSGVLESECSQLLKNFFKAKR